MEQKYYTIKLGKDFDSYVDSNDNKLDELSSLSSLNIFVGPNNTGKSRFLRNLIRDNDYEYQLKNLNAEDIRKKLDELQKELNSIAPIHTNIASFTVAGSPRINPASIPITVDKSYISKKTISEGLWVKSFDLLQHLLNDGYIINEYRGHANIESYETNIKNILKSKGGVFTLLEKFANLESVKVRKFYIPTLRSLNYLGWEEGHKNVDLYKNRISSVYQLNEEQLNLTIFTGLSLYHTVKSMLLGDIDERNKIANYEKFLSESLFNDQEVSLIPKEKDDVLHIKIGKNERPIHQLGDGIQSLIILTFPLFEVDEGLFFIEEPEMHLHPALQRKLIEVLRFFPKHQYFITTHSNHFLDLTLDYTDVSIYTFQQKDKNTAVKLVSQADENVLQLLGARNSSVFLSNCTIWVEGITDRLYIRKFLELYQQNKSKKITEDIDYSFVEYAGDNITHWSFLNQEEIPINIERLCGKSFLITDADGDRKMERKAELKRNLGVRYKLLECREIENILSLQTIERVLRLYEKRNHFTFPSFSRRANPIHPHKDEKLGNFIHNEIFGSQAITRKGGYQEKSGTIKDKIDFCKKAINNLTLEEMTPMALNLTKKIYDFIIKEKDNN